MAQIHPNIKPASSDLLKDMAEARSFEGCLWLGSNSGDTFAIALYWNGEDQRYIFHYAIPTAPDNIAELGEWSWFNYEGQSWEWEDFMAVADEDTFGTHYNEAKRQLKPF